MSNADVENVARYLNNNYKGEMEKGVGQEGNLIKNVSKTFS